MRNFCNETVYRVTSRAGLTFSPGSEVVLGSNTGHPGEFIVSEPAGGQRGASAQGQVAVLRVAGITAVATPPPPSDYPIIGIYDDGANLHAWRYEDDGTFGEELSVVARPWTPSGSFVTFSAAEAAVLAGPLIVVKSDSTDSFAIWDLVADTIATVAIPATDSGSRALNAFVWGIPFLHGGALKYMATYGSGSVHGSLWSVPVTGGTPTQLSDFNTTVSSPFRFMRYEDGTTLYWARSTTVMLHFPLDGSTPTSAANSGNVGGAYCCFAGGLVADAYWAGNDSGLSEKRQVLIRYDAANNKLIKTNNTVTGANFSGSASSRRAWSVSNDLATSGVYPHDAAPGTGSVMKLMQPLGDTTDAGNDGADPRITLEANDGNVPQYAWLYDLEHAW